ncbi:MAG TPA: helix-turn-helix domain-containing protein, partial [Streptosporangiaceae bacterium]|nr:helix-turn-helix domain-containing protein [Streptosporangiaceae bacterium]
MAGGPEPGFGDLLRRLRADAGLTQEQLAKSAGLSSRSVSDLERGVNRTARNDTARLLAGALGLAEPERALFVAAALGRAQEGALDGSPPGRPVPLLDWAAIATRTLPRDTASFTGRAAELERLMAALDEAQLGGVVGICAIGGMAGIGKTALAVHAGHQLAGGFPDGQIFLSLHGHTTGQRPVDPGGALASLLLTVGFPGSQIPATTEARAGRWRSFLANRKMLLILDDAADHEQIRPLLPGSAGSLVIVTSRRRLTALEDTVVISLDTLDPGDAADLLTRLAGRQDLSPADDAVAVLTRLCGCLPLAIGILAQQLRHHPSWTPADLAADLAAARDKLELMRAENLSVAAAFGLSYQDLDDGQRRLFRRLGLHPGPDIDAYAAAALDDSSLAAARRGLEGLYDQHLITEPARGRYRFHDLIRQHARTLAAADDPAARDAAAARLLDYYLHTARAAGRHIPSLLTLEGPAPPGRPPDSAPPVSTYRQAVGWLEAERANLHAAAGYAAAGEQPLYAMLIPAAMADSLEARGPWDQG